MRSQGASVIWGVGEYLMGRPAVRPSVQDDAAVALLCDRLISGLGMRQATATEDVPSANAVYAAMASDEAFRTRIAHARVAQQEAMIDETIDLADAATPEDYNVAKLRIWARQWRAAKLAPKLYGDKLQHTDASGSGPAEMVIKVITGVPRGDVEDQ